MNAPLGLSFVFVNVLLEQLGAPVPALPTLIVAGALAAQGRLPGESLWALALAACLIGDGAWYAAGRIYGVRVLRLLCRISLTPDICVSQTQHQFERWGGGALVVAKFVPGLSMVAPPLAGATRMGVVRFAALSVLGSAVWIGAALLVGLLLRTEVAELLPRLAGAGRAVLVIVLLLLATYVFFKWRERQRMLSALDMARISVHELYDRLGREPAPVVIDVRTPLAQTLTGRRIPGAMHVPMLEIARHVGTLPRDREIILYCTCPNEASAAQAAHVLIAHGFGKVHPLKGGLDEWITAGYPVEDVPQPVGAG